MQTDKSGTLGCNNDQTVFEPYVMASGQVHAEIVRNGSPTLNGDKDHFPTFVPEGTRYIVRRLTPTECARLQGFPDWWEDGVRKSDAASYKMWGNGMTLPVVEWILGQIASAGGDQDDNH